MKNAFPELAVTVLAFFQRGVGTFAFRDVASYALERYRNTL
jgi:hypothetical protein